MTDRSTMDRGDAEAPVVPSRPTGSVASQRPARHMEEPVPPLPTVDPSNPDKASVQFSEHRTKLSTHRTALSEHRTALSEHRTDLSTHRTDLSQHRTSLSEHRTDLSTHRTELSTGRTEMSMRRTGMSFQRTRMSADRTLMSVIRTSLSLISFGFTIYQVFQKLKETALIHGAAAAPRNFGLALVLLGIGMLALGIAYHIQFMIGLRRERRKMKKDGLIHGESVFPPSLTLITAFVLLLIGVAAILSMIYHIGPFD